MYILILVGYAISLRSGYVHENISVFFIKACNLHLTFHNTDVWNMFTGTRMWTCFFSHVTNFSNQVIYMTMHVTLQTCASVVYDILCLFMPHMTTKCGQKKQYHRIPVLRKTRTVWFVFKVSAIDRKRAELAHCRLAPKFWKCRGDEIDLAAQEAIQLCLVDIWVPSTARRALDVYVCTTPSRVVVFNFIM